MGTYDLSFSERRFLELYRRFYQTEYPATSDNNQNAHVQGQKAVYLLMRKHVGVGDYSFTWQHYGPCSDTLQHMMRELDRNSEAVKAFYTGFPSDDAVISKLYSNRIDTQRLFCLADKDRIDDARKQFELSEKAGDSVNEYGDTPIRRWVELLGSLAYISATRLPSADEERVWAELQKAKSKEKYRNPPEGEKEDALRVLKAANLLSSAQA